MYISTYEDLSALCARARGFSAVAIDTEFLRERTYHAKLCLVQIATPDECAVIDPLAIDDLSPLADLMADVDTLKVFHACSQDMEVLNHEVGQGREVVDRQGIYDRALVGSGDLHQAELGVVQMCIRDSASCMPWGKAR